MGASHCTECEEHFDRSYNYCPECGGEIRSEQAAAGPSRQVVDVAPNASDTRPYFAAGGALLGTGILVIFVEHVGDVVPVWIGTIFVVAAGTALFIDYQEVNQYWDADPLTTPLAGYGLFIAWTLIMAVIGGVFWLAGLIALVGPILRLFLLVFHPLLILSYVIVVLSVYLYRRADITRTQADYRPDEHAAEPTEASPVSNPSSTATSEADADAARSSSSGATSTADDRSLLVRAVWFLFIGWWATGIWLTVAWFLNALIITLPFGIKMINMVPMVVSLKSRETGLQIGDETNNGYSQSKDQRSLLVRAGWFMLIGWWASAIWMAIAYIFTLSVIGLPVAIWMYNKLPAVVSLYNY